MDLQVSPEDVAHDNKADLQEGKSNQTVVSKGKPCDVIAGLHEGQHALC